MESRLKFHLKNAVLLLAIVSLSVAITINFRPLYAFFVNRYHLYQEVGLTKKQLLSEYGMLLNYLNFPWIKHLQLSIPMSQSGMKHFADCKILFVFDYAVCLLTLPFATFYVRKLVKKRQTWRLINPIRWCFVVMFALGIFLVTDFEDFFVKRVFVAAFFGVKKRRDGRSSFFIFATADVLRSYTRYFTRNGRLFFAVPSDFQFLAAQKNDLFPREKGYFIVAYLHNLAHSFDGRAVLAVQSHSVRAVGKFRF